MNILTFDIETIPDCCGARKLHDFASLDDQQIVAALQQLRRQETGSEWLRPYLQRIVAISCVLHTHSHFKVWSLGETESTEAELIQRFFEGLDKFTPTLVSWNGSGFDLPVLHYRSLINGVRAPLYWETGDNKSEFRWNNYLNRYHDRHTDLMDVIAGYNGRNFAPLDDIAVLLDLPGKMGMSGAKVWDYYQQGDIENIRYYCETDVLNTHLIFLRFQLIRGKFTTATYTQELQRIRDCLIKEDKPHLHQFVQLWQQTTHEN